MFCNDDGMDHPDVVEFRPRGSRILTIVVGVGAAAAATVGLVDDPATGVRYVPAFALAAVLVWAIFGRPAVLVSDGGVELRNVLRTIALPWPAIQRIDTKYALTLYTAYGIYAAWAAPAPSRSQAIRAEREDLKHLPESTYVGGGVRPGDLAGTASGEAAAYIRRRWEWLRDAGYLEVPRLERPTPKVRWHVWPAVGVAALTALTVVALRLP